MASKLKIKVNGLVHNVTASLDTPLLCVLHNELHLHGPRFGCGLAQCGAFRPRPRSARRRGRSSIGIVERPLGGSATRALPGPLSTPPRRAASAYSVSISNRVAAV